MEPADAVRPVIRRLWERLTFRHRWDDHRSNEGVPLPVTPEAMGFQDEIDQVIAERPSLWLTSSHYLTGGMFLVLLLVSALVDVDVVVVGSGRLATDSPPMVLQPMERAILRELKVKAGDVVKKGQILATLDPTFAQANVTSMSAQQRALQAQIQRVEAELAGRSYENAGIDPDRQLQAVLYRQRQAQYQSRLNAFNEEIQRLEASVRTTEDDRVLLGRQVEVAKDVEKMRETLLQSQTGSRLQYLDSLNTRMRTERDHHNAINHLTEISHSIQSKRAERQAFIDEWRRQLLEELVRAKADAVRAEEGLAKAVRLNDLIVVQSPEDGVVLEVAKRSEGSVLREAEPLITLLPSQAALIANITISSGDIGYVRDGDSVVIKLDAFPYQRHGALGGRLRSISQASFSNSGSNPEGINPPPSGGGSAYHLAQVELTDVKLHNLPDDSIALIPGMTLLAEIKVGQRSVFSYFAMPLTRALRESMREP